MASHLFSLILFLVFISSEKIKFDIFSDASDISIFGSAVNNILEMVVSIANDSARPLPGEFNHYTLALRWPPSFCRQQNGLCNPNMHENFIINGLWPTYSNGDYPVYCLSKKQSAQFSVYNYANLDLWSHKWTKYGSCSGLTQPQYYQTALDLILKLDVLQKLKSLEYSPSPSATYDPGMIISQYKERYGLGIGIKRVRDDAVQKTLLEIYFKVNNDCETLESITGPSSSCQTTEVAFPVQKYFV